MSASEIKEAIGALSPSEQAELASWLLQKPAMAAASESDAITQELERRRQEYLDRPEEFIRFANDAEMNSWFNEIRREVDSRISSSRQV